MEEDVFKVGNEEVIVFLLSAWSQDKLFSHGFSRSSSPFFHCPPLLPPPPTSPHLPFPPPPPIPSPAPFNIFFGCPRTTGSAVVKIHPCGPQLQDSFCVQTYSGPKWELPTSSLSVYLLVPSISDFFFLPFLPAFMSSAEESVSARTITLLSSG